jgi:signal transduction histidine kinase
MGDHTDVLLALRVQVLRIAEAARQMRRGAEDADAGWLDDVDGIVGRADACRQLIDGRLEPVPEEREPAPRATAVTPALDEAIAEVERRGVCNPGVVRVVVDDEPRVTTGPETLLHILTGLLADACRHARPATPVDVAARDEVVEAHIEVTHHSDGVDRDRLDRLLLRDSAVPQNGYAPGTALNLRLVRALVESHGGYLEVEPEGDRTTVVACLPSPPARLPPGVIDLRERTRGRRGEPRS